jgi:hypothetical protein
VYHFILDELDLFYIRIVSMLEIEASHPDTWVLGTGRLSSVTYFTPPRRLDDYSEIIRGRSLTVHLQLHPIFTFTTSAAEAACAPCRRDSYQRPR